MTKVILDIGLSTGGSLASPKCVRSIIMVFKISAQDPFQMAFIPDDDMISAFSSNTAVESFDISVLPRTVVSR